MNIYLTVDCTYFVSCGFLISFIFVHSITIDLFQILMKELNEMEKVNAKLSAAVEEVTLEHCKKNEVKLSL